MSLLLEALKKAEKAKEEAQRRAQGAGTAAPELGLEPEPAPPAEPAAEAKPVLTRDRLPEISSQPLEILADEPPPKPAPGAPPRSEPRPEARAGARAESATDAAGRAAARKVFEAKFREPNPKLPFYITLGVLGAFAVGTVVYFWIQLRPPPSLVNTNPERPAGEAPVAVAAAPVSAPVAAATPAAAPVDAIPGLPSRAAAATPPAAPATRAAVATPQTPGAAPPPAELRPRPAPKPRPAPVAQAERPRAPELPRETLPESRPLVPASRPAPQVHPKVEAAYAAYLAGDLAMARTDYEQALREEPGNRDAHLGLAAIDIRAGRFEAAEATYLRLLQADPRDAEAQAALIALRGGRLDPLVAESRVKSLISADPEAHVLHFTLGNQLAQQGRWAEAQQAYFKAYTAEPGNADFAFNLAVSLEHIRQPQLALDYYRRAIALAEKRGAGFDLGAARSRVAQLQGPETSGR
jgi:tetratricopeptide (TPR) repeat protein